MFHASYENEGSLRYIFVQLARKLSSCIYYSVMALCAAIGGYWARLRIPDVSLYAVCWQQPQAVANAVKRAVKLKAIVTWCAKDWDMRFSTLYRQSMRCPYTWAETKTTTWCKYLA